MKFDRNAWIQKKRKVPRGTYMLMIFMGIYMFYIISRVIGGLNEPQVWGRVLVYAGIALLGIASFSFIMIGMSALVKRDYREAYPEEDAQDTADQEQENKKG